MRVGSWWESGLGDASLSPSYSVWGGVLAQGQIRCYWGEKVAWGPSPNLLPGCQASWGFLPGEAGGHISFFTAESHPLFTHPQDKCRKGHKDPIPCWLCSGSCTQGNFLKGWSPPPYLPLIARPIASCSPPPSLQKELPAARRMGIPPPSCPPSPGSHQPLFQALGALSHPPPCSFRW